MSRRNALARTITLEVAGSGFGTWLYSQGVSTVLLVLILVAIYRVFNHLVSIAIPKHLETIQEGYERIQSSHERQVVTLTDTFRKERELERQQVAATTQAIRELTEQLKESRL